MLDSDFQFYQKILLEKSGISLTPDKSYLLITRLTPIASSLGYESLDKFTHFLKNNINNQMIGAVVEAMTTNETSFFRDTKPFNHLRDVIFPYLYKKNELSKTIRVWCAACSTGQEPYSIAITAHEFFQDKPGWRVQILGTDISAEVLKKAQKGVYNQFEVQRGLSLPILLKYFKQNDQQWCIRDDLKQDVRYQQFNLLDNMESFGKFDIVFCRNVLIYFNQQTKAKILQGISNRMTNDGFLLLGACETVMGSSQVFETLPSMHGVHVLKVSKHSLIAS